MNYFPPASLADVLSDGAIAQADVDAAFAAKVGTITSVEFSGPQPLEYTPDAPVQVRVHASRGAQEFPGRRVARIRDGQWQWLSQTPAPLPEMLHGPATENLLSATRTVFGSAPLLLAPHHKADSVVVLDAELPPRSLRTALTTGLARIPAHLDIRRALTSFAASAGTSATWDNDILHLGGGVSLRLVGNRVVDINPGITLQEAWHDAIYLSVEHRLLLQARFPQHQVQLADDGRSALLHTPGTAPLEAAAIVLGAFTEEGNLRWSWADAEASSLPEPLRRLYQFGLESGIPDIFCAETAAVEEVIPVAQKVTGFWTLVHSGIYLALLDHLALHPSPPNAQAVRATLAQSPTVSDPLRAAQSYAHLRGIQFQSQGSVGALRVDNELISLG